MTQKILVVDDEETLCRVLKLNLENEGYDVDTAHSAEQALEMDLTQYSLLLLDIMMGEMSGIKLAKLLRSRHDTAHLPIIFCTARDTEDDVVMGLNIGADDYITKPYTIRNLLARVRSVLRRAERSTPTSSDDIITHEGLRLDLRFKRCTVGGEDRKLTKKEFELLALLMVNRGKIFSREEILSRVWSEEVVVLDRTIDVNITRLRQKIDPYGHHIITRSGYGYGFKE